MNPCAVVNTVVKNTLCTLSRKPLALHFQLHIRLFQRLFVRIATLAVINRSSLQSAACLGKSNRFDFKLKIDLQLRVEQKQLSFSFCRTTTSSAQTMSGVLVSTTTCPETAQSSCEANAYRNGQGVDGFTEGSLEYRTVTWLRLRLPA
jgi:hypothetical protein